MRSLLIMGRGIGVLTAGAVGDGELDEM